MLENGFDVTKLKSSWQIVLAIIREQHWDVVSVRLCVDLVHHAENP